MSVEQIQIHPVSPLIGAKVLAGNLATASDAVVEQVRDAIHAHQVVFLPDQHLTEDELFHVGQRLGTPMILPMALFRDEPPVSTFEITLERPPRADHWHTDIPFSEITPAFGMLSNLIAPELGGDTIFSSSYEAYDSLSPQLQQWCDTLKARHICEPALVAYALAEGGPDAARIMEESYPPIEQPLVIRHPHTGRKALFMSRSYLESIVGLHPEESDALLRLLRAPYDNPNIQARWKWTAGDLAIWDQRAVNHRGLSDHYPKFPNRKMQSIFVSDGIPAHSLSISA